MFRGQGDLANQLQRAALSVSNNIAEGFERQTVGDLLAFIHYAKGSTGEVISMCHVMRRLDFLVELQPAIDNLERRADAVARQLGAWSASQRNGPIQRRRYGSGTGRERSRVDDAAAFFDSLQGKSAEEIAHLVEERKRRKK
jgi:four helix bundle protein